MNVIDVMIFIKDKTCAPAAAVCMQHLLNLIFLIWFFFFFKYAKKQFWLILENKNINKKRKVSKVLTFLFEF